MSTQLNHQLPNLSVQANPNTKQQTNKMPSNKHLSPFTWSNIKLPILQNVKGKINISQQHSNKTQKQTVKERHQLKKIPEKNIKPKNVKNKIIGPNQQQEQSTQNHQRLFVSLQQKLKIVQEKRKSRNFSYMEQKSKTIDSSNNKTQFYFHKKNEERDLGKPDFRYRNLNSSNNHIFSQLKIDVVQQERAKKEVKGKFENKITQKDEQYRNYKSVKLQQTKQKSPSKGKPINEPVSNFNTNHYGRTINNFRKLKAIVDTVDPHTYLKQKVTSMKSKNFPIQNHTFSGNPPKYIYDGLLKSGWVHLNDKNKYILPHLIWSSDDAAANYQMSSKNQIYNHIEGLHQLTIKGQFHKNSKGVQDYYPTSFLIGQDKQTQAFVRTYELYLLKGYLRRLANVFHKKFSKEASNNNDTLLQSLDQQKRIQRQLEKQKLPDMNLGYILPKVLPTQCQQNLSIVSLCIYMQKYCCSIKEVNQYFRKMSNFVPIKVDNLNQKTLNLLLRKLINQSKDNINFLIYEKEDIIERNLQILVMHYDKALQLYDKQYNACERENLWLVKPIGGSKGKGISFFNQRHYREAIQLISQRSPKVQKGGTVLSSQSMKAFSINQKYSNKIIQKYIQNPYLMQSPQKITNIIKQKVIKKRLKQKKQTKFEPQIMENKQKQEKIQQPQHINEQKQEKNENCQLQKQIKQQQYNQIKQKVQNVMQKQEINVITDLLVEAQYQQYESEQQIQVIDEQANKESIWTQFFGRKFDFRQWVLISCKEGQLKIFRFSDGYLRFCSQKYCVDKLDSNIHLTNYSHNKFDEQHNLTAILSQFLHQKPQLQSSFYIQLDSLIINSIIQLQKFAYGQSLPNSQKNCFELLGYDFLLDQAGKLWLLQVNANPGCDSNRNQYLQKMASKMVQGLVQIATHQQNSSQNLGSQQDASIKLQKANSQQNKCKQNLQDNQFKWIEIYTSKDLNDKKNEQFPQKKYCQLDDKISVMRIIEKKTYACKRFEQVSWPILVKICFRLLKKHRLTLAEESLLDQQLIYKQQIKQGNIGANQQEPFIQTGNNMQKLLSQSGSQKQRRKQNKTRNSNQQNQGCCGQ